MRIAIGMLLASAFVFCTLALLLKGEAAIAAARRAIHQVRINVALYVFDTLLIAPAIGLLVQIIRTTVDFYGLHVMSSSGWDALGTPLTACAAVFLGDFSSYWRHRLE